MTAALPTVGDLVTCRVARINPRQATLDIICVGDLPLSEPCSGLIRREDVRQGGAGAANEPVEIYRSFRPGDIVLARVLSLGDARSYYLSCVGAELGVVLCRSATDGAVMRAVSHAEVECPVSGVRERRKVARPADLPAALARDNGGGGAGERSMSDNPLVYLVPFHTRVHRPMWSGARWCGVRGRETRPGRDAAVVYVINIILTVFCS